MSEGTVRSSDEQAAVDKYKTLARGVAANDVPACHLLLKAFKDKGGSLSEMEVSALGLRWLSNDKSEKNFDMIPFLKDIGFDFSQTIILDQKNEQVGMPIPFRLLDDPKDHPILFELLDRGVVEISISDGVGDSLLQYALQQRHYDAAENLLAKGADLNHLNMSGATPLHFAAHKGEFAAVEWLCSRGADPTIENLLGHRASEVVPEEIQGGVEGNWDVDALYNVLEDYVEAFGKGKPFEPSEEFQSQVAREHKLFEVKDDMTVDDMMNEVDSVKKSVGM